MRDDTEILLVAPYDRYPSIDRFVACLERELSRHLPVNLFRPAPVLARFSTGPARKWVAYLDKFLLVPRLVQRAADKAALVHLTDQSLAMSVGALRGRSHLVNCNDLIAIRSARGELPERRPAWTGRALQNALLRGLHAAPHVVCLSNATKTELIRLARRSDDSVSTIPMGLHYPFRPLDQCESAAIIRRWIPDGPFLLHVGGNQWYKNRPGLIEIYRELIRLDPAAPRLVLIGDAPSADLAVQIERAGLGHRISALSGVPDSDLAAFYSRARALIFPSLYEGFGWPILEAQACGCPVLTSNRAPMTEVAGNTAVYLPVEKPSDCARLVSDFLSEPPGKTVARTTVAQLDSARFSTGAMVAAYLALYSRLHPESGAVRLPGAAFA